MSSSDPDPRPRPQYGEYATPEEQKARIKQPAPHAAPAPAPASASSNAWPAPLVTPASAAPAPVRERRVRPVDRIVTFALLAYGLVNVISSIPAFLDYGAYTETVFRLLGVSVKLTDPAAGKPFGLAAAIVLALGWLITAAVSWWSLRRGRMTWWIPVVGGIIFTMIAGTLMVIPLMSDPAAWNSLINAVP